jgi:hypothetical protein
LLEALSAAAILALASLAGSEAAATIQLIRTKGSKSLTSTHGVLLLLMRMHSGLAAVVHKKGNNESGFARHTTELASEFLTAAETVQLRQMLVALCLCHELSRFELGKTFNGTCQPITLSSNSYT